MSPRMKQFWRFRIGDREAVKPDGQELCGGMYMLVL